MASSVVGISEEQVNSTVYSYEWWKNMIDQCGSFSCPVGVYNQFKFDPKSLGCVIKFVAPKIERYKIPNPSDIRVEFIHPHRHAKSTYNELYWRRKKLGQVVVGYSVAKKQRKPRHRSGFLLLKERYMYSK